MSRRGFTLLEIMVALAILSFGLLSLIGAQGNSLRASGRAENIQTASLLGRQIMNEKLIEFQKNLLKGSFPDEKEENGAFDPPLDRFRWEFKVRKVEIPVIGESGGAVEAAPGAGEGGGTPGTAEGTVQAPESAQRSLAQMVTKKISESVREISAKVLWDELGEEQSLTLTTHVSRVP
jgi:prepilin-type N-terminal cleavage/methylation domain-containing protein